MASDSETKFTLRCAIPGHEKDVRALASLYFPEGAFVSGSRDVTSKIWRPNEEDNRFSERLVLGGHNNYIMTICVIPPNEKYPHGVILTGSNDHMIHAYTLDSPEPKYRLAGHEGAVSSLAAGKFGTVISGSWDNTARVWLEEKCVLTLKGHTAAVWAVAIVPGGGYMLTGSADKTIRLWKTGNIERTFTGHEDSVRGIAVLNSHEFLSCSNDNTVRRWLISGECVATYFGHTNYIYSIACLPNGRDFVTSGEDRTLRVWRDGVAVQTITHPALSVWSVCVLSNGDIITGASDGVIRVFTQNPSLVASLAELTAFEESVASCPIPAQVGDIKVDDLPGVEALINPGKREGQTMMIRNNNSIEAYQWEMSESRWTKIGDVVGGSSGSSNGTSGKVLYGGKEYDYVFDVELDGHPSLKLPYNLTDDPWMASHNFLEKNELSQMFLDQVAAFIQSQTAGITLGTTQNPTVSDPFTGGSRYMPGSVHNQSAGHGGDPFTGGSRYVPQQQNRQFSASSSDPFTGGSRYQPAGAVSEGPRTYFPETTYIKYDTVNVQGVMGKLREFNSQADDGSKLEDADLEQVEKLLTNEAEVSARQLDILWRLMQWPMGVLFPVLDILRFAVRSVAVNQHFCNSRDGPQFIKYCSAVLSAEGQPKNHLLILRTLCNAFQHSDGLKLLLSSCEEILSGVVRILGSADKNTQVAISSLILNYSVAFRTSIDVEGKTQCLIILRELCNTKLDAEVLFRLLVSLGTIIAGDLNSLHLAKSFDLMELVNRGVALDLQKAKDCARILAQMLA